MSKKEKKVSLPEIVASVPSLKEEIDIDALRKEMIRGMYSLESSLYKQATEEQARLNRLRKSIGHLETELFDPEFISELTPNSKVNLYKVASENMQNVINFMMSLHKTVADGAGVLNQIESMKDSGVKKKGTESEVDFVNRIQELVKEKIIEKIKNHEEKE